MSPKTPSITTNAPETPPIQWPSFRQVLDARYPDPPLREDTHPDALSAEETVQNLKAPVEEVYLQPYYWERYETERALKARVSQAIELCGIVDRIALDGSKTDFDVFHQYRSMQPPPDHIDNPAIHAFQQGLANLSDREKYVKEVETLVPDINVGPYTPSTRFRWELFPEHPFEARPTWRDPNRYIPPEYSVRAITVKAAMIEQVDALFQRRLDARDVLFEMERTVQDFELAGLGPAAYQELQKRHASDKASRIRSGILFSRASLIRSLEYKHALTPEQEALLDRNGRKEVDALREQFREENRLAGRDPEEGFTEAQDQALDEAGRTLVNALRKFYGSANRAAVLAEVIVKWYRFDGLSYEEQEAEIERLSCLPEQDLRDMLGQLDDQRVEEILQMEEDLREADTPAPIPRSIDFRRAVECFKDRPVEARLKKPPHEAGISSKEGDSAPGDKIDVEDSSLDDFEEEAREPARWFSNTIALSRHLQARGLDVTFLAFLDEDDIQHLDQMVEVLRDQQRQVYGARTHAFYEYMADLLVYLRFKTLHMAAQPDRSLYEHSIDPAISETGAKRSMQHRLESAIFLAQTDAVARRERGAMMSHFGVVARYGGIQQSGVLGSDQATWRDVVEPRGLPEEALVETARNFYMEDLSGVLNRMRDLEITIPLDQNLRDRIEELILNAPRNTPYHSRLLYLQRLLLNENELDPFAWAQIVFGNPEDWENREFTIDESLIGSWTVVEMIIGILEDQIGTETLCAVKEGCKHYRYIELFKALRELIKNTIAYSGLEGRRIRINGRELKEILRAEEIPPREVRGRLRPDTFERNELRRVWWGVDPVEEEAPASRKEKKFYKVRV